MSNTHSWGWTYITTDVIAPNASVTVPTPGFDANASDPATTQVAVDGRAYVVPDEAGVSFGGASAVVTNKTGNPWPAGAQIYVYVAALETSGGGSSGGIPEAPGDGNLYARQSSQWVPVRPPLPDDTNTYGLTGASGVTALNNAGAWAQVIPTAGGTIDGPLTVNGDMQVTGDFTMHGPWLVVDDPQAPAAIFLSCAPGNYAAVVGQTSGVDRWRLYMGDYTPEAGSNAGSDLRLEGHDDGGSTLGAWLTVTRATGAATFGGDVVRVEGDLQVVGAIVNPALEKRVADLERIVAQLDKDMKKIRSLK